VPQTTALTEDHMLRVLYIGCAHVEWSWLNYDDDTGDWPHDSAIQYSDYCRVLVYFHRIVLLLSVFKNCLRAFSELGLNLRGGIYQTAIF